MSRMCIALLLAAQALRAHSAWTQAPRRVRLDERRLLGTPRTHANLTLIPVYDPHARPTGRFITLDEGLRSGPVTVTEAPGGGDVNAACITNLSAKTLYVMAGEVILGGKQDRCLGRDALIPPGAKKMRVPVFCVEHGRWSGAGAFAKSAQTVAAPDVRAVAQEGGFSAGGRVTVVGYRLQSGTPAGPALHESVLRKP